MVNLSFNLQTQIIEPVQNFVKQSERVINVTHKPSPAEFRQISYITAIAMTVVGVIGFIISMAAYYLRAAGI